MSKFNPVLEDETYWKYQGLVESWLDFVHDALGAPKTEDFQMAVAHIVKKIYDMGYEDACKELNTLEELDEDGKIFN